MFARRAWDALIDLLLPPRCLVCGRPPRFSREPFCEPCAGQLFHDPHECCPRCAATVGPYSVREGRCSLCRTHPPPFDAALRLTIYRGAMQQAILRIKSAAHEGLAELLGRRWGELQRPRFAPAGIDAVLGVPLHWWRRWRRGYNQAGAVARGLATSLGYPCRSGILRRVRLGPAQKQAASAAQRQANVRNAFRAVGRLDGQRLLLVDDVMTTGATVAAAAAALKQAGAVRVVVAVLARAEV